MEARTLWLRGRILREDLEPGQLVVFDDEGHQHLALVAKEVGTSVLRFAVLSVRPSGSYSTEPLPWLKTDTAYDLKRVFEVRRPVTIEPLLGNGGVDPNYLRGSLALGPNDAAGICVGRGGHDALIVSFHDGNVHRVRKNDPAWTLWSGWRLLLKDGSSELELAKFGPAQLDKLLEPSLIG